MSFDLAAAASFMQGHARMVDRRRFDLAVGAGGAGAALDAVSAYRNADGGYGWGLEPDLRSAESQPAGALHAFEVFAEAGPVTSPEALALCDWLGDATLDDGGVPFALPVTDPAACAPFWAQADHATSSLQITGFVTAMAHRVAGHDSAVAAHPWLARASAYCCRTIDALGDSPPHALVLNAAILFADAAGDTSRLDALRRFVPADGLVHVAGGLEDESMRPLDFAPFPDRRARSLFDDATIAHELERLANRQEDDGGWSVDFTSYSPAATLEWRGYATVHAVQILTAR